MREYNNIWYTSSDGLKLFARDYQPAQENNNKAPTILCMHGLTRNSADFEDLCEELSSSYRMIVVDQRGRGLSDYDPNPDNYNPAVYVQDMFALLESQGVSEVILLGTSMGGIMAMLMTAIQPNLVKALVINDIGPEVAQEGLDRLKKYVGVSAPVNSWEDAVQQTAFINGGAFPDASDEDWLKFAKRLYREDKAGRPVLSYDPKIANALNNTEKNTAAPTLWPVYEQIKSKPMLLIRGQLSDILDEACVKRMQKIKPDLNFCQVPEIGHAPMLTEQVARSAIDEFLSSYG